jgi:hypothetical protein
MWSNSSSTGKTMKCTNCNCNNHVEEDCPKLPCSRCQGTGHTQQPCRSPSNDDICFVCGNIGQRTTACQHVNPTGTCGICGGYGHGGSTNTNCATRRFVPMCVPCGIPHHPQDCPGLEHEYPEYNPTFDACTNCGKSGHVFRNCPTKN